MSNQVIFTICSLSRRCWWLMNLINFLLCYFAALYPGVCWCTFYHIDLYYNITPRCTICRNFTVKSWLMPVSHERGSSAVRVRMCVREHPQASVSNTGVPGHQSASQSSPPRSKQTQNICIIFIKRWPDVEYLLYKCFVFAGVLRVSS